MHPGFDLALGLLRHTPIDETLDQGVRSLMADLEDSSAFRGDLGALWSPPRTECTVDLKTFEKEWAPVRSITPVWLSRMARPAVGENKLEGILYQIYCRSLDPHQGQTAFDHYHRTPMHPSAMGLCIALLTLSHFPRRFLPEIVGVTLAHASWVIDEIPPPKERHERALAGLETALARGLDEERIRKGFSLYREAAFSVSSGQRGIFPNRIHREVFAKVVTEKALAAKGYHAKVRLEGRALDEWFEDHGHQPEPLLRALENSPLVDTACPYGSRLIKAMDFKGPMFGVFDAQEREAAARWIASPESMASNQTLNGSSEIETRWRASVAPSRRHRSKGIRNLFHLLVAAENSNDLPDEGILLIRRILGRTQRLQQLKILPKPFRYEPARLDQFLHDRHRAALQAPKRRFFSTHLTREDWRWTFTQLSPAVLVDGAWLSGVASLPSPPQPWHLELIKIHEDELGNGDQAQNHPRIYRRLLESIDIHLPKISDPAFTEDARIHTSAFTFPAYMVAMGWHYAQFEPECLGLNLAIELSGLGSGYQKVITSLRQARIDPLIAELHLSIDNLASGHARRARDAIVLYLEHIARAEGPNGEARAFERIHQGFQSYSVGLVSLGALMLSRHLLSGHIKISK